MSITPYYQHGGVTIYCGDARKITPHLQVAAIITDPVWPNSVFDNIEDPRHLLSQVLKSAEAERVVIQLGCDSDPRFLSAVPERWAFFRACWLEHSCPHYKGRLLYTSDVAYVFGDPPASKEGAHVMPGRVVATRNDGFSRGTRRNKEGALRDVPHPCPRKLQHVQWLCKWFGGESVLDPFVGSGTTALACKELGIPFIGIEIEERFCALAVSRLSQETLGFTEAV